MLKPILFSLVATTAFAADDTRTAGEGVYSTAQAERGKKAYAADCARCHGEKLEGGRDDDKEAPPVAGEVFLKKWLNKPLGRLVDVTRRTMPPETAGTMSRPLTIELVAFILSANNFPAGNTDLTTDAAALRQITFEPKK